MTIKRLLILQAVLLVGLSIVFILPKSPLIQPAGIALSLPEFVGQWYGGDQEISPSERGSLGPDTEFARKLYTNGYGDEIFVSIVLAGPDMNTSIHRPERCLPAQGWTVADSKTVSLPAKSPDGETLRATRLHNRRNVKTEQGGSADVFNLNYYWFVGYTNLTPTALGRTMIDIRDRLLKGYNQRWAYVTVAAIVTKDLRKFGRSEVETDAMIAEFIERLFPTLQTKKS